MSRQIVSTNIRFNLEKEADRTVWEYLQHRDKKQHRSYSRAVIAAVNDYFERRGRLASDSYLETGEKEVAFLLRWKPSGPGSIMLHLSAQRIRYSTCCRTSRRN